MQFKLEKGVILKQYPMSDNIPYVNLKMFLELF